MVDIAQDMDKNIEFNHLDVEINFNEKDVDTNDLI